MAYELPPDRSRLFWWPHSSKCGVLTFADWYTDMARPQFTIRDMLCSITLLAVAIGSLRAVLTWGDTRNEQEGLLLFSLWVLGGACLGAGTGVVFNKSFLWGMLGAMAAVLSLCLVSI